MQLLFCKDYLHENFPTEADLTSIKEPLKQTNVLEVICSFSPQKTYNISFFPLKCGGYQKVKFNVDS